MASTTLMPDGNAKPTSIGGYAHITSTAPTAIKSGEGFLYSIIFNTPIATSVVEYGDTATAGRNATAAIGTITIGTGPQPFTLPINTQFTNGLSVTVATAASDITVVYR